VITFDVRIFPTRRVVAQAIGEPFVIEAESLDAFKALVVERVHQRFHRSIRPLIRLHYIDVEHL